jgi:N-glycosylase/DNA lyase
MNRNYCSGQEQIESAVMKVCDFIDSQRRAVKNWEDYSEERLWFELVSCILGSRVRYETAKACATHLQNVGLLDVHSLLKNPRNVENGIRKELHKSIYPPFSNGKGSRYRHPKSKSGYIVNTGIQIYKNDNSTIKDTLAECRDGSEARDVLIKKCAGIGPKQASLFLRNISFCDDLAILDSHVIRYLELLKLSETFSGLNLKKKNLYFKNENTLRIYAITKRKSLATLDIGIWIVMRLVQRGL